MRLLLDTHVWLWSLSQPERIAPNVQRQLRDASTELWLSSISLWEALLLRAKGRIQIEGDVGGWVGQATRHLREAPLTHEIVVAADRLPFSHADLADRFIAATAQVLKLTLVTADQRLLGLGEIATLANR